MNALELCADSFHTKKPCSRLSSSEVRFFYANWPFCVAFFRPPLGDLGATYDDHLRLIARSGLPISIKWTFIARCYGWGATSDYRFKIGDFAPTEAGWPKISSRRGHPSPTNHFSSQKTRLNYLSYGIKIWTDLSTVLSQSTRVTDGRTDRQTDRILIARPRLRSMQRAKNQRRLHERRVVLRTFSVRSALRAIRGAKARKETGKKQTPEINSGYAIDN